METVIRKTITPILPRQKTCCSGENHVISEDNKDGASGANSRAKTAKRVRGRKRGEQPVKTAALVPVESRKLVVLEANEGLREE